jgi:hypothetical protein
MPAEVVRGAGSEAATRVADAFGGDFGLFDFAEVARDVAVGARSSCVAGRADA